MKLEVLFFASLRESLGRSRETIEAPETVRTVGALREHLCAQGSEWSALRAARTLRVAVNQEMVTPQFTLHDGDEIAFFPPVTGG